MRYLYTVMASVSDIGLTSEAKAENGKTSKLPGMSVETCRSAVNKTSRESYWFAHGGLEEPKNGQSDSRPTDLKELQLQKDKEERVRIFREQQEGERLKRLKDLEQQFLLAKKHREQQEEERKRRIEEARIRETERRQQVEERKRQIWEAEQERKEAILRRNMEREARIEARRNAQRNSQCFAFGSSTPRTFDLDLAAIGIGRNVNQGSVLMSSVSGRRSEERELGPPRATSACSLDRKFGDDCMSRSMVSLSTFRGRKRTDIMPTLTRERSITPHVTPRGNQCMRAVSMTRLDQLAQPRRTYHAPRNYVVDTTTMNGGPRTVSPSMSKSMCNLANSSTVSRRAHVSTLHNGKGNMSQSMLHLADTSSSRNNRHLTPSPTLPKSSMRSAQSMMHLAAAPRLTRAARLRAQALAAGRTVSAWNLNKVENYSSGQYLSPGKDTSRSPSRPQSSMSGASEISATSSSASAVNMRPRPAPRRPRPYSIAGSTIDHITTANSVTRKEPERQPRLLEKNVCGPVSKPQRAKSAGREKSETEDLKPLNAPKKPVPPPKSSEVLARAKSHPVPIKDNLRKPVKSVVGNKPIMTTVKKHSEESEKKSFNSEANQLDHKLEKNDVDSKFVVAARETIVNSPVKSPTSDSEMCLSSDDSKFSVVTESDANTFTHSLTESEYKEEAFITAVSDYQINSEANRNSFHEASESEIQVESIPNKFEEKILEVNNLVETLTENNSAEMESSFIKESTPSKPRITSEEEAKAALAEKRRLAREQAEREAELERQRQEEISRQEEEQRKLEELEQKRMEEEQIRLAELHRKLEEEKLKKAIEEQMQREKEEQERKEEEARQKAEKEELERKAREEAEKQRIELEERLRKEEEERAERKRRVEQIMARTRGKAAAQATSNSQNETTTKTVKSVESGQSINNVTELLKTNNFLQTNDIKITPVSNGCVEAKTEKNPFDNAIENSITNEGSDPFSVDNKVITNVPLPDLLNSEIIANHSVKNSVLSNEKDELLFSNTSVTNNFSKISNRTLSANEITSPTQTNGYSSHEEMSCTTSPEEVSSSGLLINIENSQQKSTKVLSEPADFTKLVDIETSSFNISNENYLINVDDVNSNLLTSDNTFGGYEETKQKKQDSSVADLLS